MIDAAGAARSMTDGRLRKRLRIAHNWRDQTLARREYLATAIALFVAISPSAAQHPDSAVTTIHNVYLSISRADTVALRALLSGDLRWVLLSSGAVATKQQLLSAASHPIPGIRLEYQMDSVRTWQRGDVSTVDYALTTRRTFRAYQTVFTSRASDTFIREKGRWQLFRHTQTWLVHPPETMSLDSLQLAQFVGRYDRGNGYIDDVHFKEGYLVAQSTYEALMGSPGAHLYPVSRNTFSPERSAPMIAFERDEGGWVTGYVQQQPDGTIARAPRLANTKTLDTRPAPTTPR